MNEIPWRERIFEDFKVGDRCEHRLARTVTGYDNMLFTLLTQNPAPLHLNHHFVTQAGLERVPLNSTLTLALVTGQSVADLTPNVMTNLGWIDVTLPAPAYEGDTIYSESRIESLRESSKRPNVGIVGIKTVGYTQDGTVVIEFVRTVMMYRRGCVPAQVRPQPNEAASR
ncbi:MaoC family dehydratase [Paraburkholderia sp. SIMBA_049]